MGVLPDEVGRGVEGGEKGVGAVAQGAAGRVGGGVQGCDGSARPVPYGDGNGDGR